MTNKMLEMYVRNQILIHPTYSGEDVIIQGERYDTRPLAKKCQEESRFKQCDGTLELYMTAIRNNDSLKIELNDTKIPLSSYIETFKESLLDKSMLDAVIDKFMPYVIQALKAQSAYGANYIIDDALLVNTFSEDTCNRALQHVFGNSPSKFVYTWANGSTNGNFLDFHTDVVKKFNGLKQEFFTYASFIRALGYPYSDYKMFVSKGLLVSIDMNNKIYVVHNDYVYCISQDVFNNILIDGTAAIPECRKVFSTQDLVLNTHAPIGGLR